MPTASAPSSRPGLSGMVKSFSPKTIRRSPAASAASSCACDQGHRRKPLPQDEEEEEEEGDEELKTALDRWLGRDQVMRTRMTRQAASWKSRRGPPRRSRVEKKMTTGRRVTQSCRPALKKTRGGPLVEIIGRGGSSGTEAVSCYITAT